MNLGRAKSILIIAFTCLNIFLGYHLFWPDFGRLTSVAVTAEDIQETEAFLNENNYFLQTSLERSVKVGDFLTVSPAVGFQGDILQLFIKKGAGAIEAESATAYKVDNKTAYFYPGGLIRISFEPALELSEDGTELDEENLRDKVESLISEELIMPEGLAYDRMEIRDSGKVIFKYHRLLEGKPIYASNLQVVFDSGNLGLIEVSWLDPVEGVPRREMEVISTTDALVNLVDLLGPSEEPINIKSIDLGYFSAEYDAEKWEIPPVWRVQLGESGFHYVNAFTGNVEDDIFMPEQLP